MRRTIIAAAAFAAIVSGGGLWQGIRWATVAGGIGMHFAANGNFDASGRFTPFDVGFNLADVDSLEQMKSLPPGTKALVWIGSCKGTDPAFIERVEAFAKDEKLFGFYLMDDPDPTGQWHPTCLAENLRAEADWIHARAPGFKTFVALMNMKDSEKPSFVDTYNPENTHVDLFGIAPYPCRAGVATCDLDLIDRFVAAAHEALIPKAKLVPIFQAFGAGNWRIDGNQTYAMPDPAQEASILKRWAELLPAPTFDYAYSWSPQQGDVSLANASALHDIFRIHNRKQAAVGDPIFRDPAAEDHRTAWARQE